MMKNLSRYINIWLLFAKQELLFQLSTKISLVFFFFGKLLRFVMFLVFLLLLQSHTKVFAGYSVNQAFIFYLTFNFIDVTSQMILRGVYTLTGKVRTGEFDFYLAKPISPLFRTLVGSPDFNDLLLLIPVTIFSAWYILHALPHLNFWSILTFIVLLINGLIISLAFHIVVVSIGIVSAEVDNTIMVYRDLSQMARFPIDIYRESIQFVLTFILPVGIMMSVPAKALLGLATPAGIAGALAIGGIALGISLAIWNEALKRYTSASS